MVEGRAAAAATLLDRLGRVGRAVWSGRAGGRRLPCGVGESRMRSTARRRTGDERMLLPFRVCRGRVSLPRLLGLEGGVRVVEWGAAARPGGV